MVRSIYNKFNSLQYTAGIGRYSALLKRNATLKDSAAHVKRAFILATGPSIQEQDLSVLKGEYCISVSNFFVHALFNEIKPAFHIFAGSHAPITPEQMGAWWQDTSKHLGDNRETKMLIHARDKVIQEKYNVFGGQEVFYYVDGGHFPVDFTRQIPEMQTIVHVAMYLGLYLGIQEIYLLGCDHSWLLHYGKSMHFYKETQHSLARDNYSEWQEVKDIGNEFETHANLWKIYRSIRKELRNKTIIYNATPGSLLDIFPRVDLEQALNKGNK